MSHTTAKQYLKGIKVSITDFKSNCEIDDSKRILTLNHELNFIIPQEVFDDLAELKMETVH